MSHTEPFGGIFRYKSSVSETPFSEDEISFVLDTEEENTLDDYGANDFRVKITAFNFLGV